jgi:3-hydroxybutyrate dehydrogenase
LEGTNMLANKSALITGSFGGIGLATAKALAAPGCDITLKGFASAEVIDPRLAAIRLLGGASRHPADPRQPSRKFVRDDDVAGMFAFLSRPHAEDSKPAALPIDGAWTAGR